MLARFAATAALFFATTLSAGDIVINFDSIPIGTPAAAIHVPGVAFCGDGLPGEDWVVEDVSRYDVWFAHRRALVSHTSASRSNGGPSLNVLLQMYPSSLSFTFALNGPVQKVGGGGETAQLPVPLGFNLGIPSGTGTPGASTGWAFAWAVAPKCGIPFFGSCHDPIWGGHLARGEWHLVPTSSSATSEWDFISSATPPAQQYWWVGDPTIGVGLYISTPGVGPVGIIDNIRLTPPCNSGKYDISHLFTSNARIVTTSVPGGQPFESTWDIGGRDENVLMVPIDHYDLNAYFIPSGEAECSSTGESLWLRKTPYFTKRIQVASDCSRVRPEWQNEGDVVKVLIPTPPARGWVKAHLMPVDLCGNSPPQGLECQGPPPDGFWVPWTINVQTGEPNPDTPGIIVSPTKIDFTTSLGSECAPTAHLALENWGTGTVALQLTSSNPVFTVEPQTIVVDRNDTDPLPKRFDVTVSAHPQTLGFQSGLLGISGGGVELSVPVTLVVSPATAPSGRHRAVRLPCGK